VNQLPDFSEEWIPDSAALYHLEKSIGEKMEFVGANGICDESAF
jgi:hypothetical protein